MRKYYWVTNRLTNTFRYRFIISEELSLLNCSYHPTITSERCSSGGKSENASTALLIQLIVMCSCSSDRWHGSIDNVVLTSLRIRRCTNKLIAFIWCFLQLMLAQGQ